MVSGTNWTNRLEYLHYRKCRPGITWYLCTTTYLFVRDNTAITAWGWRFFGPSKMWDTHYHSVNNIHFCASNFLKRIFMNEHGPFFTHLPVFVEECDLLQIFCFAGTCYQQTYGRIVHHGACSLTRLWPCWGHGAVKLQTYDLQVILGHCIQKLLWSDLESWKIF
jgi:hypothetical protein